MENVTQPTDRAYQVVETIKKSIDKYAYKDNDLSKIECFFRSDYHDSPVITVESAGRSHGINYFIRTKTTRGFMIVMNQLNRSKVKYEIECWDLTGNEIGLMYFRFDKLEYLEGLLLLEVEKSTPFLADAFGY